MKTYKMQNMAKQSNLLTARYYPKYTRYLCHSRYIWYTQKIMFECKLI